MIVCVCKRISDLQIRQAVCDGCHTMEQLRDELGVASQCGRCGDCALEVVVDELRHEMYDDDEAQTRACM